MLPEHGRAGSGKGGANKATETFQLIILGKARYKLHAWNARVVKCWKEPQRRLRTFLPGREWVEGLQGLVGEEQVAQRGLLFWEAGSKAPRKKERNPQALRWWRGKR